MPNSISIIINEKDGHFRLLPNKSNSASVFKHLIDEFKLILKEASPGKVISSVVWGDNLFYVMRDLLNIQARQL